MTSAVVRGGGVSRDWISQLCPKHFEAHAALNVMDKVEKNFREVTDAKNEP
jgi:hypothetical protein